MDASATEVTIHKFDIVLIVCHLLLSASPVLRPSTLLHLDEIHLLYANN